MYTHFFSLWLFPFQGLPQRITMFHFNLFFVSSTLTPVTCMSFFTASINLLFGLSLHLIPCNSIFSILLPMYPLDIYIYTHNRMAGIVYRNICSEYGLDLPKSRWETLQKAVENNRAKLLWDFQI